MLIYKKKRTNLTNLTKSIKKHSNTIQISIFCITALYFSLDLNKYGVTYL